MKALPVVARVILALGLSGFGLLIVFLVLVGHLLGPEINEVTEVRDGTAPGTVQVSVESRTARSHSSTSWTLDDEGSIQRRSDDQPRPARTKGCADADCYRVVPGRLRVERRHGDTGAYTVAWEVGDATYRQLAAAQPDLGDPAAHLSSRSLVVHKVGGGHVVFVANGRDGLLYRDVTGGWHRLGSPQGGEGVYFEPPPRLATDPRPLDLTWYAVGVVVLVVLLSGAIPVARRRPFRFGPALMVVLVALAAGAVALLGARFPDVGMFPGVFYGVPVIFAALVLGSCCALLFAIAAGRGSRAGTIPGANGH
ncbi:hypothetical protein [Micromonospora sp. IBHARD004]|uniref:hypothetical protein n=1 Tax=Micromonospora sp. IBHARD004 TaxID=3457764 RepID=UPI004059DB8B